MERIYELFVELTVSVSYHFTRKSNYRTGHRILTFCTNSYSSYVQQLNGGSLAQMSLNGLMIQQDFPNELLAIDISSTVCMPKCQITVQ